ncbi:MAG: hypothetical protein CMJ18_16015 [Phycisphaeraceae bacterium]|nr:hypothetical protein [Phycisphaeraceae bacterium]
MTARRYPQALLMGVNTPWTERYELHEPMFRKHTDRLLDLGFTHLYVGRAQRRQGRRGSKSSRRPP